MSIATPKKIKHVATIRAVRWGIRIRLNRLKARMAGANTNVIAAITSNARKRTTSVPASKGLDNVFCIAEIKSDGELNLTS